MSIKKIETSGAPAAIGPYSQGIVASGFLFGAGQIPVNPKTGEIPEGIEAQAEQVLKNMGEVLNAAGASFENVVKTTVFLKDLGDFAKVNDIYAHYFKSPYPARSCVEAKRLPKDVLIEIEFIASLAD